MKATVFLPMTLSLLAMALVGCGEDDDGVYGSGGNKITLTSFSNSYDNQANASAIARIEQTYRTGGREIKIKNLVNSYNNQSLNNLDRTVLADDFEGRLENNDIEVNGRTVKRPIYETNSNNKLNYETTYKTLDLAGLNAGSYSSGTNIDNSRGIITDLNNYPDIPANVTFPAGSVCYIPVVTSERSFLAFSDSNKTGYSTLNRWIDAAEERFNDDRDFSTSRFGVGFDNDRKAAQVTFFEFNNQPAYRYNGVEYDNDIYEADYVAQGRIDPNTNSVRGVVDCTLVNEVAGDFLAAQITRYY